MDSWARHRRTALLGAMVLLAGCGTSSTGRENDRLRRQVRNQDREIEALENRNRELAAELASGSTAPGSLPEAVRADTPRVAQIAIDRLGHVRADDAGGPPVLVLYVTPTDGRGRFVQLVGDLTVNAAVLPAGAPARTVGEITLDPAEVRDAYHSGFMGTHYTVEVPLAGFPAEATTIDVRVFYTDGRTGQRHEASSSIAIAKST